LWDRGTYEPEGGGGVDALRAGYERGDLKIVLHGKRLRGGWVLVRMRRGEGRPQWLLIKHRDETASSDYDVVEEVTTSVATRRTMEQIAAGRSRVWRSNRSEPAAKKKARKTTPRSAGRKAPSRRKRAKA
jgi:bifunctional non-homologous end joining protein LigD